MIDGPATPTRPVHCGCLCVTGTDPGKLKKLWFLGALLEQRHPLGMYDDDLLLFVDAFDVLLQRRLPTELPRAFAAFVRISRGQLEETASPYPDPEAVVVLGEHNCWPWPQPEVEGRLGSKRPRGVSMGYMRNATFKVHKRHIETKPHHNQDSPSVRILT